MSSITFNPQARDFMARKTEQFPDLDKKGVDELIEDLASEGRDSTWS